MLPEGLKDAWEKAEAKIDAGSFDDALADLRASWDEFGEKADHANTWRLVGDARNGKARVGDGIDRKGLRGAHDAYQKALKLNPKHREARRADNALLAEMDGMGVRATALPSLWTDGAPTIYGLFAILIVGMLFFSTLKYMPEIKHTLGLSGSSSESWDAVLTFELYPQAAPRTVDSFKDHSNNGRYDGIAFHRIIDGFMIQGGDIENSHYPIANAPVSGQGSPGTGGYSAIWYGEGNQADQTTWAIPDEFHPDYRHAPGILAMANSGQNTGGSQFYIVDKDSTPSHLDGPNQQGGGHTVFGMATEGTYLGSNVGALELIDMISQVETGEGDRPVDAPYIHSIEINGDFAELRIIIP